MKVQSFKEIEMLLQSDGFEDWIRSYRETQKKIKDVSEQQEKFLVEANVFTFQAEAYQQKGDHAVFEAGETEELSGEASATHAEIENESFESLSTFEQQRKRATQAWEILHRAEKSLDDERLALKKSTKTQEKSKEEAGPKNDSQSMRVTNRLRDLALSIEQLEKSVEKDKINLQKQEMLRDEIWFEIEDSWSRSFRANMARTEHAFEARRLRDDAEMYFASAILEREKKSKIDILAEEKNSRISSLEQRLEHLLDTARESFGCTVIRDFLYWLDRDDVESAFVVALIDENRHFNIQIKALRVYKVRRDTGLEFISPLGEISLSEGEVEVEDPRLDGFFLEGRYDR